MKYSSDQDQNVQKPQSRREPNRPGVAGLVAATTCLFAATAVLLFGCKSSSPSGGGVSMPGTLPMVYSVENTGTKFPAPPLPTLDKLPFIQPLPDPFAWAKDPLGNTRSTKFRDWDHHRAEMEAEIENYEIGIKPPRPDSVTATYSNGMLTVNVSVGTNTIKLSSRVILPAGSGPFPAIIGMNSPSGSVNRSLLTNVAKITFSHDQVTRYGRAPSASDPYYILYPELLGNSGQYSAWAWGVSRLIDGLELVQNQLPIDLKHIGVTGCSYAGKMALFSGALDQRVALTIAQESGGGGDTTWRYSATEPLRSVEGLAQTDHKWFRSSMFQFGNSNVSYLPEDHHMLCALVAPRALFATGNTNYTWLSNPSAYICDRATEKVYDTLGVSDRFGFNLQGGHAHCATTPAIDKEMGAFINKFLLGQSDLNTTIRDYPTNFASIDYARWTAWWGTTKPILPN
jgi:dienelactone hydrolase